MEKGFCRICGEYKDLSFEHIPPKSAHNKTPVTMFSGNNSMRRCKKGMGLNSLCVKCNNDTGAMYVESYKKFVELGLAQIKPHTTIINYESIKPMNILKQICTLFMSTDDSFRLDSDLVKFILDKNNNFLPEKYKLYCYLMDGHYYRVFGKTYGMYDNFNNIQTRAEIAYPPYGFILTVDSSPPNASVYELSDIFKSRNYNDIDSFRFKLPYITINPNGLTCEYIDVK